MKAGLKKIIFAILIVMYSTGAVFAVDHFKIGVNAFYNQDYQTSYLQLKQAVKEFPYNQDYHYFYAQTLIKLSKLDEAVQEYNKIIELAPYSNAAKLSAIGISKIQDYLVDKYNPNKSFKDKITELKKIDKDLQAGLEDNYIDNAINEQGLLIHWDVKKMPLNVYFYDAKGITGFQQAYIKDVEDAYSQWTQKTESKISFKVTTDLNNANIVVKFVPAISSGEDSNGEKGSIGGLTRPYYSGCVFKYSDIKLTTIRAADSIPYNDFEMYNTALHELGHALGISGHSPAVSDVMYAIASPNANTQRLSLSSRDVNTIKLLYKLDADISNFNPDEIKLLNKDKNSNIIGDVNARLDKKLKEALDYTKQVSYLPISWSKLGDAYSNMKNYSKALESYEKALTLDPKYLEAKEGIARTYSLMNDIVNTSIAYQDLILNNPKNIAYSNNLALFYINNNRFNDARNVLNALLTNNPDAASDPNVQTLIQILNQ